MDWVILPKDRLKGEVPPWLPKLVPRPMQTLSLIHILEVPEYMTGHWTFAVFAVDSRDKTVLKGTNSDVIMICEDVYKRQSWKIQWMLF